LIEFKLYKRIVSGDLRPNLSSFDKKDSINSLEDEFFTRNVILDKDFVLFDENFNFDFHGIKNGDTIKLNIEDGDPIKFLISVIPNTEDELFDINIPLPIDKKSEIFFQIIENEFNRIKSSAEKQLEKEDNQLENIRKYALFNIQYAKNLGKEAHRLQRALEIYGIDNFKNSNTLILYSLKKHIIYSIMYFQELFNPILQIANQTEHQAILENKLFEMEHSKRMSKVQLFSEELNKRLIKRLYKEIGIDSSLEEKISFFKKELKEQNSKISKAKGTKYGIPSNLSKDKILLEKELTKLLTSKYETKLYNSSFQNNKKKYVYILEFITKLKVDRQNEDRPFLNKNDFFDRASIEIEKLEKLISLKSKSGYNITRDLISTIAIIQGRKHLGLSEDQLNDYLSDLLRVKGYYITDQTRNGRSGSKKIEDYKSGELDIAIRDIENNGVITTIIEAFELSSCGEKNTTIQYHINKLLTRYDTSGNKENYIIVYAKASNFIELWEKFKNFVNEIVFNSDVKFSDNSNALSNKTDIKTGYQVLLRENSEIKINYIFANMKK